MTMQKCERRPSRRGLSIALAAALALTFFAASARAADVDVKIDNFVFTPQTLTIKPGTTVTWTNGDDIPHSLVASQQGLFRSRAMDTGETFRFTFTSAGTFEYFCGLHPHMKGMIVVAP